MSRTPSTSTRPSAAPTNGTSEDARMDGLLQARPLAALPATTNTRSSPTGHIVLPGAYVSMHRSGAVATVAHDWFDEADGDNNGSSHASPASADRTPAEPRYAHGTTDLRLFPAPGTDEEEGGRRGDDDDDGDGVAGGLRGDASLLSIWISKLRRTSPWTLLRVVILCAGVLGGQATEVIMLNFWLRQFPSRGENGESGVAGNYTIFAVSGLIFFVFFLTLFVVYVLARRPDLRFMREPRAWGLVMRAAAMDTLTSALSVYAASHTSEVLQALFISMVPLYASVFTKLFLRDPRQYWNRWVFLSFACIVAGVFVATSANFVSDKMQIASGEFDPVNVFGVSARRQPSHVSGSGSERDSGGHDSSQGESGDSLSDRRWWALLFCAAIPLEVLMGVFQTLFMLRYTHDPDFLTYVAGFVVGGERERGQARRVTHNYRTGTTAAEGDDFVTLLPFDEEEETDNGSWWRASHSGGGGSLGGIYRHPTSVVRLAPLHDPFAAPQSHVVRQTAPARLVRQGPRRHVPAAASAPPEDAQSGVDELGDAWMLGTGQLRPTSDDTTVKLTMLCLQTFFQCVFTFIWMPMDALPWYGGSDSVAEAWTNFAKGVNCLVHCPNNLLCGALYSAGFVFVYIGAAYLNQYSVTLCAMVSQMSGPVTALLLIAFPALNVTGDTAPWYVSLAAVCLLVTGTFVYVVWDEKTAAEKEAGELELKMKMHGLHTLAARHAAYTATEITES